MLIMVDIPALVWLQLTIPTHLEDLSRTITLTHKNINSKKNQKCFLYNIFKTNLNWLGRFHKLFNQN